MRLGRTEASARAWRKVAALGAAVGLVVFIVLVAGCASSGSTPQATGTVTTASGSPRASGAPTDTPYALTPIPTATGSAAQVGAADICSQPADVQAQPPTNVPRYPGADLHMSQTHGGNGFYGYCTSDPVNAVAQFYTQQLPDRGWSNIKATTISSIKQITATQGSAKLTVTIAPDAVQSGTINILVVVLG